MTTLEEAIQESLAIIAEENADRPPTRKQVATALEIYTDILARIESEQTEMRGRLIAWQRTGRELGYIE